MFKFRHITDIFFDLDHTLWDFEKNSALAFYNVFEKHQIDINLVSFLDVYEAINLHYWKLYREEKITKQELRRGRLTDAFAKMGLSFHLDLIDGLAASYIDLLPLNNHLFPGTVELLEYLKPKYNLHIITNGFEEVQTKKLANSNIARFFCTVTNSELAGVKKPNPKIFEYALKTAKTYPEKSVMIGDSLEADILGAEAVGMHTLFFNAKNEPNLNRFSVHKLHEIKTLF